ncbi:pyridoxamine 5'-phosphate oxidase family protein [Flindersiella endophytica]
MDDSISEELNERARQVIDGNFYMTLGTIDPDNQPRVSPVYFTHGDYRRFYWISSPAAHHSVNVAERPAIALVIFNSTAPVGEGRAVYVGATAEIVPDDELPDACAEAFANLKPGGARAYRPEELSSDTEFGLYRATATSHEIHVPGRDPDYGTGIDRRVHVEP